MNPFENAEGAKAAEGGRHRKCAFLQPSAHSAPSAFSDRVVR